MSEHPGLEFSPQSARSQILPSMPPLVLFLISMLLKTSDKMTYNIPYLPTFPVCPPFLGILLYDIGAGPEITLSPRGDLCAVIFTPALDVFCNEIIPGGAIEDVFAARTFPEFGCNLHARPLALNVRRRCGLK